MPKIKAAGADVAKLLWFFRPDGDRTTADHQRALVRRPGPAERRALHPAGGGADLVPAARRGPAAARSGRRPGSRASSPPPWRPTGSGSTCSRSSSPATWTASPASPRPGAACAALDAAVTVPWVILSAGVGFDDFVTQVQIACEAGASGYLAGRSVWRDAVSTPDPDRRAQAVTASVARIDRLTRPPASTAAPSTPASPWTRPSPRSPRTGSPAGTGRAPEGPRPRSPDGETTVSRLTRSGSWAGPTARKGSAERPAMVIIHLGGPRSSRRCGSQPDDRRRSVRAGTWLCQPELDLAHIS